MRWFRNLALTRKLVLLIVATCSVAVLINAAVFVVYDLAMFRTAMTRQLTILADVLANNSTAALTFNVRDTAEEMLSALRAHPQIVAACVYDQHGRVFATYGGPGTTANVPARAGEEGYRFEHDRLVLCRPVILGNKKIGTIYLESDLTEWHARLRLHVMVRLVVMVFVLLLVAALAVRLQRVISRPVLALASTAKIVSERKDFSVRAEKYTNDELGLLTDAFNQMLANIQQRDADLHRAHDELELRVEERTAELRQANEALQAEIAERQRAEVAVKIKAAELARSNAELEQFAYVASHDLQEPLRMVSSFLQLLERRCEGKLDKEATEFISYAIDGAARMRTLIKDLLEYSRVGRKGQPLRPTDCEAVVQTALKNLQAAIKETKARVVTGQLPTVRADATELAQLFQNLIGNAIKFHNKKTPEVHVEATRQDREWLFSVRDNGIGIDPQFAERIFVIFQRLHTRDKYPGTGIGLAICRKIVERHGGRIWVESQLGAGATFYFTLPITHQENKQS